MSELPNYKEPVTDANIGEATPDETGELSSYKKPLTDANPGDVNGEVIKDLSKEPKYNFGCLVEGRKFTIQDQIKTIHYCVRRMKEEKGKSSYIGVGKLSEEIKDFGYNVVKSHLHRLLKKVGIKLKKKQPVWPDCDNEKLREIYSTATENKLFTTFPDRTLEGIIERAKKLGLKNPNIKIKRSRTKNSEIKKLEPKGELGEHLCSSGVKSGSRYVNLIQDYFPFGESYNLVEEESYKLAEKPNDRSKILTIDNLAKAIQNSVGGQGIERNEAQKMAIHMLDFFGYENRIVDNILGPDDRDVFYMMEDSGLMMTAREEVTLYNGKEWRINYWLLCREKIEELINNGPETKEVKDEEDEKEEEYNVYDELPEDVWKKNS